MSYSLDFRTILRLIVFVSVLNILLIGTLAGAGVLKTAQQGDITYTTTRDSSEFFSNAVGYQKYELPEHATHRFANEAPTDADIYYNTGITAIYAGPIYLTGYKYAPPIVGLFVLFSIFGYIPFKIGWLIFSVVTVIIGTYWLLDVETTARSLQLPRNKLFGLSLAAVGFSPMISNFKSAQITPIIYLCIAFMWYAYRIGRYNVASGVLVFATLIKPYFGSPLITFLNTKHDHSIIAYAVGYLVLIAVSVVVFGVEPMIDYIQIILYHVQQISHDSATPIHRWSVEAVKPLFFLEPFATLLRVVFIIPIVYPLISKDEKNTPVLFSLSIIVLPFVISDLSVIDLGVLLAPMIVLGVRIYKQNRWQYYLLAVSFLLVQAHPYFMEIFVGRGHWNLANALPDWAINGIAFFQPAAIGLFILYYIAIRQLRSTPW